MLRRLWLLACTLLYAALASTSLAGIKESKSFIVGTNDHTFIDVLVEHGAAPANLGKRRVLLLVRLGAAYADVTICADTKANAKSLAAELDQAFGFDDTQYSQEDDYAAARTRMSAGQLFSRERSWDFDLAGPVNKLREDGWQVYGGVKVASDAKSDVTATPILEIASNSTYTLDSMTGKPIHLDAKISSGLIVLVLVVGFGPLTGLLFGCIAAYYVVRQKQIELARRRVMFKCSILYPVFAMIGLCLPLSLFTIYGGHLMPLADLWFGTSSAGAAFMPIIMLSMPIPFLVLLPLSGLEGRIFSENADKPDYKPPQVVPLSKTSKKPMFAIMFVMFAIGFCVVMGSFAVSPKSGLRQVLMMLGYAITFSAGPIAGRIAAKLNFPKIAEDHADPLLDRAVRIASLAKCPLATVSVAEPRDASQMVAITFMYSRLTITRKAVIELSDSALDFGIAHSLATKMFRTMGLLFLFIVPMAFIFAFFFMPYLRTHLAPEQRSFSMLMGMLPMLAPIPFLVPWITRVESKRQIREALAIVPDRAAAQEWIEKSMDQPIASVRPKMYAKLKAERITQINQLADEMGLPK